MQQNHQDFEALINWSRQFNHLPWRQNRSLYKTFVSEIMLQQTTVPTVLNKFPNFLAQYPTLSDLAQATEEEVLIAWKGLGYYRRAKNLLAAAQYIKSKYSADIPTNYNKLINIPGIGDYTANAILAIGNEQKTLAIDTNLERVIARYYGLDFEKGMELKKAILKLFNNKLIFNTKLSFRALNEALMDLGREYCTIKKTLCNLCPLSSSCKSKNAPLTRPKITIKKTQTINYNLSLLRVIITENNNLNLWCYKKSAEEWLSNQWECPTFIIKTKIKNNHYFTQYPSISYNSEEYEKLKSFKTNITKYKISNYILTLTLQDFYKSFSWERELCQIPISNNSNFSTATQKTLKVLNFDNICC
jgi:A/G-specific adenine glycosylase